MSLKMSRALTCHLARRSMLCKPPRCCVGLASCRCLVGRCRPSLHAHFLHPRCRDTGTCSKWSRHTPRPTFSACSTRMAAPAARWQRR